MTELQGCIHYFEAELNPPCFLNPATVALFQSTLKFLKRHDDICTRYPTIIANLQPAKTPEIDTKRSLHHIKQVLVKESPEE